MSHQPGQRVCGRSSVSNRLVADLAGDDLSSIREPRAWRKTASEKDDWV